MISICLVANIFYVLRYTTPQYLKAFIPFLLISLILEIATNLMAINNSSTVGIYNFSSVFEICFYLWVLYKIIESNIVKRAALVSMAFYIIISISDIVFYQHFIRFHSITYSFGCLFIVFFTIVFFYQLFAKPKAIFLTQEPSFWICTALLLFYSVTFPLFALVNFMSSFPVIITNNLLYILIVLNVFLYLLFSIAFLCRIKIKKS